MLLIPLSLRILTITELLISVEAYKTPIMIANVKAVAKKVKDNNDTVLDHRTITHDSYCFNWDLFIPHQLQIAHPITHEFMHSLDLSRDQEPWQLACNLRSAFSGIVTGNVKENGIKAVAAHGPFKLHGEKEIIDSLGQLLESYIKQGRVLLSQKEYKPCYVLE